jgi:deoxyribodipyrimidine photo-lyase
MSEEKIAIMWFRRDLRLEDNTALYNALRGELPVLPLFIFDTNILNRLKDRKDRRIKFIHQQIKEIHSKLGQMKSTLLIEHGDPLTVWKSLLQSWNIGTVYANRDYEPYGLERDKQIEKLLQSRNILFFTFKDQVIFEKEEIVKEDGNPYSVFTPYKNKWRDSLGETHLIQYESQKFMDHFYKCKSSKMPSLKDLNFVDEPFTFPDRTPDRDIIKNYHKTRDFPALEGTTRLGLHLRFGTISIRQLVKTARQLNEVFLNELIWREFFMMILHHHPRVIYEPFHTEYQNIRWINNDVHFQRWCEGKTGYPLVDAGMRELNESGYMHNRVRMVTAGFLVKDLLIDWRCGEQYFAEKLLDFELSSNNGNWQWSAGCGCDAAPYFRIFNPESQAKKFDPEQQYIKKWLPEFGSPEYPNKLIDHKIARERTLQVFRESIKR